MEPGVISRLSILCVRNFSSLPANLLLRLKYIKTAGCPVCHTICSRADFFLFSNPYLRNSVRNDSSSMKVFTLPLLIAAAVVAQPLASAFPADLPLENAIKLLEEAKERTIPQADRELANIPVNGTELLEKRDATHIYVCTDINWSGNCQNLLSNRGQCCKFSGPF